MSPPNEPRVVLCDSFDHMRATHIRLLDQAGAWGPVHVFLWSDDTVKALTGEAPKFPQEERLYYVQSIRYVREVTVVHGLPHEHALPESVDTRGTCWVVPQDRDHPAKQAFAREHGLTYQVIARDRLDTFPAWTDDDPVTDCPDRPKVLVTGCYDWFHTGHVRFFEEVSELGNLYVVVGHDRNIRLLKGDGHPMFGEQERRYIAGSIRFVKQALISTGNGWLDAEPEIKRIRPDIYAVNEDGDKPVKRQFCEENGIRYVVLKRLPKPGLPRRESTHLRGF